MLIKIAFRISVVPLMFLLLSFQLKSVIPFVISILITITFYFTIFRVWKNHYNEQFIQANLFAKMLESKSTTLRDSLQELFKIQIPKHLYWVDFGIDPSSFEVSISTHSTEPSSDIDFTKKNLQLLKLDKSTISKYKKSGQSAEENIELALELIQRWFAEIWSQEVRDDFRIRATFSVHERFGHFNLKNGKWEDANIFYGKPLE